MDAWALRSHQRAVAAIDNGSFDQEIMPIEVVGRDGTKRSFAVDEHPRRDTSLERLASRTVLHPDIEGFCITAGNATRPIAHATAVVIPNQHVATHPGLQQPPDVRPWGEITVHTADTHMNQQLGLPKQTTRA